MLLDQYIIGVPISVGEEPGTGASEVGALDTSITSFRTGLWPRRVGLDSTGGNSFFFFLLSTRGRDCPTENAARLLVLG